MTALVDLLAHLLATGAMAAWLLSTDAISVAWLLSAKWLLACVGSLAAGGLAWLLLSGAAQLWPALRTRRAVWLAAQGVVAIAALLPFLPRSQHLAPPITLAPALPVAEPDAGNLNPSTYFAAASTAMQDAEPTAIPAATSTLTGHALPLVGALWLLVYMVGLARALARQLRARRLWRGLLASAERLQQGQLQAHIAFTAGQRGLITQRGLTVMRTEAAVSPMLIGVLHPTLLLPSHMDALTAEQQQMIIAHELHHWRVHDPLCLTIAAFLQTVFWFNPTLRWMAKQMEWALELQCDQHVLAGRPQHQRKQYAVSLMQQWAAPMGVAAFNGATITARIRHMQKNSLPALNVVATCSATAALCAVLAAAAVLQPALAFNDPMAPSAQTKAPQLPTLLAPAAADSAPTAEVWRAPLDTVRVTSFFGVKRSVPRTPHRGIDFGATKGTPVHATASGIVIAAGPLAENDGKYGNAVIIDHGAQRSLYAHLNSVSVQPGQRVQAGQLIGAVGETGLATGPHLHLEVRQNGQIIDPASMFTNLDAHATARALKVRRQQLPSKG